MSDTVLVVAWLVFSHLVADFVLQNDWIALNKGTGGRVGWAALGVHGFHVALCLAPVVFAFGPRGLVYLVLVTGSHMIVDRWKVQATRRAERQAQAQAQARLTRTGEAPPSGLGAAWSPWPGILFLADQALHLTFLIVGWLVLLQSVTIVPEFAQFADAVFGTWDRSAVHATILTGVVLTSLFIVNTRGAFYFVLALVSPRELAPQVAAVPAAVPPVPVPPAAAPSDADASPATDAAPASGPDPDPGPAPAPVLGVPSGAPARIGATIGALERLLVVAFILVGAEVAVGFVLAAKTIARFRQLDDRGFAEYYLLGTLASWSVAIFSAELARVALRTLGGG